MERSEHTFILGLEVGSHCHVIAKQLVKHRNCYHVPAEAIRKPGKKNSIGWNATWSSI